MSKSKTGRNLTILQGNATIGVAAASGIGDGPDGKKYDQAVSSMVDGDGSVQVTLPESAVEKLRRLRDESGGSLTIRVEPQDDNCRAVIVIENISPHDAAILIRELYS